MKHIAVSEGLVTPWKIPSICGDGRQTVEHPYISTRTHVYIVNETRPFSRPAFFLAHEQLADTVVRPLSLDTA